MLVVVSHKQLKVLVIGDYAVGKTSIIKRYTEGFYTPNYKLTIGVDFAVKGKRPHCEWHAHLFCSFGVGREHHSLSAALGCCRS